MKKYIDLEDMASVNCATVLNSIQESDAVSRREITVRTGLSWGGMTKIVNKLLEKGYIKEEKPDKSSSGGRIAGVLRVNTEKNFVMGLDINKTGLRAVVMNLRGDVLQNYRAAANAETKDGFLDAILRFTETVFADFPEKIISIGVAMQGIVNYKTGVSVRFPGISEWENVSMKEILETKYGVSVFVEHDPDCLLYPHIDRQSRENVVLLRIDKSIGMAVAIGDKIIKGEGIFEIAHQIVLPGGKACHCGQKGCLEAYIAPCMENDTVQTAHLPQLLLPLAVTIKNLTGIFNARRVIITGALAAHHSLFSAALQKELDALGSPSEITFCDSTALAVKGAAQIAVRLSIKELNV